MDGFPPDIAAPAPPPARRPTNVASRKLPVASVKVAASLPSNNSRHGALAGCRPRARETSDAGHHRHAAEGADPPPQAGLQPGGSVLHLARDLPGRPRHHLRPALDLRRRRSRHPRAGRRDEIRHRHELHLRGARRRQRGPRLPQCLPPPRRAHRARLQDHGRQPRLPLPLLDLRPRRQAALRRAYGRGFRPRLPRPQARACALAGRADLRLPLRRPAGRFRRHGGEDGALSRPARPEERQGRLREGHHRAGQLEAHHGEQPRVLSLRGQPSRADRAALRLWLRLRAGGARRARPQGGRGLRQAHHFLAPRMGELRLPLGDGRAPRRHGHRLPHRAPAARRRRREPHRRHQGRLQEAARQDQRSQARRAAFLDPAE